MAKEEELTATGGEAAIGGASATVSGMSSTLLRATVRNGRLVLDEPTDLPDGDRA